MGFKRMENFDGDFSLMISTRDHDCKRRTEAIISR